MPEGAAVAEPVDAGADDPPCAVGDLVTDPVRLRQRAVFLRELEEARAILARATPRHVPYRGFSDRSRRVHLRG